MPSEVIHADARPLTSTERSILDALLVPDFHGADALRYQSEYVLAYASCTCGCGSIGFEHLGGLRPGPAGLNPQSRPGPHLVVQDPEGIDIGDLVLVVRDGLLDDLEVSSFSHGPLPLPQVAHIRIIASIQRRYWVPPPAGSAPRANGDIALPT
jgi:hypothetical protein